MRYDKLRFEIWAAEHSQECAAVSDSWDRQRAHDARLVEAFYASTHEEALRCYHEHNGWKPCAPMPGLTDQTFAEDQLAEQEA